jgi:hypothetical protein
LHLSIIDSLYEDKAEKISIVGSIKLSDSYNSIIVNYLYEMFTQNYMITYNNSIHTIDFILISEDEWAESSSWTQSMINKDSITTIYTQTLCEPICIDTTIYKITKMGIIIKTN